MSLTKVYNDWFQLRENPYRYWIPINDNDKKRRFNDIHPYLPTVLRLSFSIMTNSGIQWTKFIKEHPTEFLVLVILLDQYYRTLESTYKGFTKFKRIITTILYNIIKHNEGLVNKKYNIKEKIFICMPSKHMIPYGVFDINNVYSINWDNQGSLFCRFYSDFVDKYYRNISIEPYQMLTYSSNSVPYYRICEYYKEGCLNYIKAKISDYVSQINNILYNFIKQHKIKKICVSLSGGVDSMVMLHCLSRLNNNNDFELYAFHLDYNNRPMSHHESILISTYCYCLNVKLFQYKINYAKRNEMDRETYESITRYIRFECYRHFKDFHICLGHIRDDYVENIITNFATNKHISHLGKFEEVEKQDGVIIARPFLNLDKDSIFEYAYEHKIPFLLNTTPKWCNRGKFRNKFIHDIKEQYGDSVLDNVIKSANKIDSMSRIIEDMIIRPNVDKFIQSNEIILTDNMLDEPYIIKNIFEEFMKSKNIGRPTDKSIENLIRSIPSERKIDLKKGISFRISGYKVKYISK